MINRQEFKLNLIEKIKKLEGNITSEVPPPGHENDEDGKDLEIGILFGIDELIDECLSVWEY